jgi:LmbE family N-acetylglucosaminyl deacetylase
MGVMKDPLTLLAVFAHPDDETFRAGGTLALLSRLGVRVELLTFTHGEAGSCGDPPICTPEELSAVRERELHCACAALCIQPPRLLDYPDGGLKEIEAEGMIAHILSAADECKPQVWLSFDPEGLSGHPDHQAVSRWTREAYDRAGTAAALYTVAVPVSVVDRMGFRHLRPIPDEAVTLALDVSTVWKAKLSALRCHATQWTSSPILNASEEDRRLFLRVEHFLRAACRDAVADFLPELLREHVV